MDTKHLYEFVALAEAGNFWQASSNLFISQSSLSKHIMSLEKELGVTLFDRTTRRVRLSAEGELFLPYAVKVIEALDGYAALSKTRKKGWGNILSIGSTSQMTHYQVITDALANYKRLHLDCQLNVVIESHKNLKELLLRHKVDFIWSGEPEDEHQDTAFDRLPFFAEPLVAVFSRRHPLSAQDRIPLRLLDGQDVIIQDNSSIEQKVFLDFCEDREFQPRITSLPGGNILNFVQLELGVAIMLRSVAQALCTPEMLMAELEDSPIVHVNLLSLKGRRLSPIAKDFLAFLGNKNQCV